GPAGGGGCGGRLEPGRRVGGLGAARAVGTVPAAAAAGLDGDRRRGGRGVAARTAGRHQHRGPGGAGGAAPGGRRGARGRPGPFSRDARVSVPVGYLATVALVAWCTGFALAAPSRPRVLAVVAFWSGLLLNEQPFLALVWLSAATALVFAQGDV